MNKIFKILVVVGMLSMPTLAAAKTLVIGLDFSGSSPLSDQAFADRVASKVSEAIRQLQGGDTILVRSFGLHSTTNSISQDYKLTKRLKSRAVAKMLATYIRSIPKKKLTNEQGTSMLGFLGDMGTVYTDCSKEEVTYFLITDAVETSSYADITQIIKTGKGQLPQLKYVSFQSCDLVIYGVARGWDAVSADALKGHVYTWADAEGFNRPLLRNNF